jgi:hypothetical protein
MCDGVVQSLYPAYWCRDVKYFFHGGTFYREKSFYRLIGTATAGYDLLTMLALWITRVFSILKPVETARALFLFLPDAIKKGMLPAAARRPTVAMSAPVGFTLVPKDTKVPKGSSSAALL